MIAGVHHHIPRDYHLRNDSWREVNQTLFSRIASDLEQWNDGITMEMVERTYCTVSPAQTLTRPAKSPVPVTCIRSLTLLNESGWLVLNGVCLETILDG